MTQPFKFMCSHFTAPSGAVSRRGASFCGAIGAIIIIIAFKGSTLASLNGESEETADKTCSRDSSPVLVDKDKRK